MSILQSSDAKMLQSGIEHHEKLESMLADPKNEFLANEIKRLREVNEMLSRKIDSLPGRPNQWNPHG